MVIKTSTKKIKSLIKKIESDINVISCSGGDDNLGHPAVYYNFGDKKQITCQYCGTIYLKSKYKKKKDLIN